MNLDPNSLSKVDEVFLSTMLILYWPLLLLLQYDQSDIRAFLKRRLATQLTDT